VKPAATLVLLLAVIAAALLLIAGPGTRLQWWDFRSGFQLMRWSVYVGLAAVVLATGLLATARARAASPRRLLAALVLGLVAAGVPLYGLHLARTLPPIHDISTDLERPPAFVAVLPLRADATNPAEHAGADLARQQREGYPDIDTLELAGVSPDEALARAERTARAMGWEIVATDAPGGRLEATDTTLFFGFKDDIVIRVEPDGADGSRIDLRSVSRVGISDVGANARRIRGFMAGLGTD